MCPQRPGLDCSALSNQAVDCSALSNQSVFWLLWANFAFLCSGPLWDVQSLSVYNGHHDPTRSQLCASCIKMTQKWSSQSARCFHFLGEDRIWLLWATSSPIHGLFSINFICMCPYESWGMVTIWTVRLCSLNSSGD